jgi:7-cyano-7-deazaguanine synthase in queuosine biosynthesis
MVAITTGDLSSTVLLAYLRSQGHQVLPLYLATKHSLRHAHAVHETSYALGLVPEEYTLSESLVGVIGTDTLAEQVALVVLAFGYGLGLDHPVVAVPFPAAHWAAFEMAEKVARVAHGRSDLFVYAPLTHKTKADIVRLGSELNAPIHQAFCCLKGGDHHCGTCRMCLERREAFSSADLPDPATYRT